MRNYAAAVLLGVLLAFVISMATGRGGSTLSGRLGGDYPMVYGAGRAVLSGDVRQLYSWERQAQMQRGLFPGEPTAFLYFPYPPYVALAYAPLALLDYRVSYALHTILMFGALFASAALLRPALGQIGAYSPLVLTAGALLFYPMFRGVFGQNTPLTLLLVVLAWRLARGGADLWAGVCLALLLYKPQFALIFCGLLLLAGRWRVLAGIVIAGGALYVVGAVAAGWGWPMWWWQEGVVPFHRHDQAVNRTNSISWLGLTECLFGVGHPVALALGWAAALLTIVILSWVFWRRVGPSLDERMAVACAGAVLIPPHCMYYDAGLILPALAMLLDRGSAVTRWLVLIFWLGGAMQVVAKTVGFSPVSLVAAGSFMTALTLVARRDRGSAASEPMAVAGAP